MPLDTDLKNRILYQSCLQNAMSIISSLIDYQVENFKQNTNNLFASKLLINVCIDFLLQHINDIKAPICLRCLTSLAKVKKKKKICSFLFCILFNLDYTWTFNSIRNK
jgi:hypothetical protein